MKLLIIFSIVFIFLLIPIQDSFSDLEMSTNTQVYSPEHTLQVYGTGLPGENLILRLFGPDESITKFDQVQTDSDGNFNHQLLTWPAPSHGALVFVSACGASRAGAARGGLEQPGWR